MLDLRSPYLAQHPLGEAVARILEAALQAVEPAMAVRRALAYDAHQRVLQVAGTRLSVASQGRIWVVAVGKAAYPMAYAAREVLGDHLHGGVVLTKAGHAGPSLPPLEVREAGHPVPDARGVQAAQAIEALLAQARADDLVLLLLSGGGSALLVSPAPPLSLEDLRRTTDLLLASGATITEVNAVRKHLERLKGGQLARLAAPARVVALVLSDVLGDPLDAIASGPAAPDPTTFAEAWAVLVRYGLAERVPRAVRERLQAGLRGEIPETPKPGDLLFARVRHHIVGSVRVAAEAALTEAQCLGFHAAIATTTLEGEAREVGRALAAVLREMAVYGRPLQRPACLIWGGETTVTLGAGPHGRGGRNQELALAAVYPLAGMPGALLVAFATDGTDGPTDAAGAVVDGETLTRAWALGRDPRKALARHDAYDFFAPLGALLRPGPTRTNVNDLTLLLTIS
ncbi:MAG TPA: glycerate kinase [Anaerolineae bacterium]|nr:glycerate kinase [Anaerolineae bacterium]HIQ08070.1 glycerate kinase [Anaerolineaceae bacterium]